MEKGGQGCGEGRIGTIIVRIVWMRLDMRTTNWLPEETDLQSNSLITIQYKIKRVQKYGSIAIKIYILKPGIENWCEPLQWVPSISSVNSRWGLYIVYIIYQVWTAGGGYIYQVWTAGVAIHIPSVDTWWLPSIYQVWTARGGYIYQVWTTGGGYIYHVRIAGGGYIQYILYTKCGQLVGAIYTKCGQLLVAIYIPSVDSWWLTCIAYQQYKYDLCQDQCDKVCRTFRNTTHTTAPPEVPQQYINHFKMNIVVCLLNQV